MRMITMIIMMIRRNPTKRSISGADQPQHGGVNDDDADDMGMIMMMKGVMTMINRRNPAKRSIRGADQPQHGGV